MLRILRSCAALPVVALCSGAILAQDFSCPRRVVPVSLRDKQNLPITNASVDDLEAKVRGKPVKMVSLAPDPRPHRVVLILDASGSMGTEASDSPLFKLEFALASDFLLEANRQRLQIALLIFNTRVTETVDFAEGNSAVAAKLRQISNDRNYLKTAVKGTTALRDAVLSGLQLLGHPTSADALYVLTDGGDNASERSVADVSRRLALASVRLFAVLLYQGRPARGRTPEELFGPQELADIASMSGSEILTAAGWRGKQITLSADPAAKFQSRETLARLYQTIVGNELLAIELPFDIPKNQRWELKLSNAARHRWPEAHITYPATLLKCGGE